MRREIDKMQGEAGHAIHLLGHIYLMVSPGLVHDPGIPCLSLCSEMGTIYINSLGYSCWAFEPRFSQV